ASPRLSPLADANGVANGLITSKRPMLMIVIPAHRMSLTSSQLSSIGLGRILSVGMNDNTNTRYKMPKPISTHLTLMTVPQPALLQARQPLLIICELTHSAYSGRLTRAVFHNFAPGSCCHPKAWSLGP